MYKILPPFKDQKYTAETISDPQEIQEKYLSYLSDESKTKAHCLKALSRPRNLEELSWIVQYNYNHNIPSRISGARTGLAAAAVPEIEDCLISLDRMKKISELKNDSGNYSIEVQAGVTLNELDQHLKSINAPVFFPVDPTETSASYGGMCATNASGARSYFYGAIRNWVLGLELVLVNGTIVNLERAEKTINPTSLRELLEQTAIPEINDIKKPAAKNTIGYYFQENSDLLDLFIGSEGTLCLFSKIKLKLEKIPAARLSYLQCFLSEEAALSFVELISKETALKTLALEYLDRNSIDFAMLSPLAKKSAPAKLINNLVTAVVYLEIILDDANDLESVSEKIEEILAKLNVSSELSFAGIEERDLTELKIFRHAVPEQINAVIAQRKKETPELHKIATDMAVPKEFLKEIYYYYKSELDKRGYQYAIFGHAGDAHFHVNLLPRNAKELAEIKTLYLEFAKKVVGLYGAVAAEHGIGKLKKKFLSVQYEKNTLEDMKKIKTLFDPKNLLNRGVII